MVSIGIPASQQLSGSCMSVQLPNRLWALQSDEVKSYRRAPTDVQNPSTMTAAWRTSMTRLTMRAACGSTSSRASNTSSSCICMSHADVFGFRASVFCLLKTLLRCRCSIYTCLGFFVPPFFAPAMLPSRLPLLRSVRFVLATACPLRRTSCRRGASTTQC